MPCSAEPNWVRHVHPESLHQRGAFYLILAFFMILANLFIAPSVHARAKMGSAKLTSGSSAHDPRISGDTLANPEAAAVQEFGSEGASFAQPTRTPRPTSTPPVIPPPASPTSTGLMILLAALVMAVILAGIWINRRRVF